MKRTCQDCAKDFDTRSSRQKFCSDQCRMRAHYKRSTGQKVVALPSVAVQNVAPSDLVEVVRAELVKGRRETTPMGVLCLVLASQIAAGVESPSGLAQLSRELSARLAEALQFAEVAVDPIDELRARREARSAGR